MGVVISTDERGVKIWVDEKGQFPRYSYSISKKNEQGKYDNCYIQVKFKRGLNPPANGTDILIKSAFQTFDVWTDKEGKKHTIPVVMIMDFEPMVGNGSSKDFVDIPAGLDDVVPFR
jgi:hypothetical protein